MNFFPIPKRNVAWSPTYQAECSVTQVSFAIPYHFVESSEINDVETSLISCQAMDWMASFFEYLDKNNRLDPRNLT